MRIRSIALLTAALLATACGKNDNNDASNNDPSQDMSSAEDMSSTEQDMGAEDMDDAAEDMSSTEQDMEELTPCQDQTACAMDEACLNERCVKAPPCERPSQNKLCARDFTELGADEATAARSFCDGAFCRLGCIRDSECPQDHTCTDNGLCVPFTGDLDAPPPGGEARADLKAGVGNALMRFPIGLPLGGYGTRASNSSSKYGEALRPSRGQMHGLYARAVLLDNGERQVLLVRMPIIFPTGPLHEAVARRLQEETGKNWRGNLIISGTHTHSGPGRYLHLPPPEQSALPLGSFGTDNFNQQAFDWVVESTMDAVDMAFDDLSDARFGWEIVEAFDNDDMIASDRWGATPPFDDNRLLLMRVDDLDGAPRALLFSFGMHGTFNSSDYATGDSMGGIERALEARFGEEHGRFVPTLFFNQNGGTMSPRGDRHGHREQHKFEHIGYRFVERMWPEVEDIDTDRDVDLASVTVRFPLGYETLGYEPDEWTDLREKDDELVYGGLLCSVDSAEDNDYTTYLEPNENHCFGIDKALYNRPPTLFLRSQMTALTIDGLTVVTLPGEAAMELGWQVLRELQTAHGVDPLQAWVWGYAQDHQFYLTPTNLRGPLPPFPGISTPMAPDDYPAYAFSYFQGGYEAGFTIWGPRMGDFLVERAVELVDVLLNDAATAFEQPYPVQYTRLADQPFPIDATPAGLAGTVVEQPPAQVERLAQAEFAWVGGDPGAEMPQAPRVVLEREDGGAFSPVLHANTLEYSNREPLMLSRVRHNEDEDRWEWVVYWEELKDFPTGRYRFHVEGHYQDEAGERQRYDVTSDAFELVPSDALEVEVEADATSVRGTLAYPAAARLEFGGVAGDPGRVIGTYRMRHPDVPTGVADPVIAGEDAEPSDVTVRISQGGNLVAEYNGAPLTVATNPENVEGRDGVPVTRYEVSFSALAAGTYDVTVSVTDTHGNTGEATTQLVVP